MRASIPATAKASAPGTDAPPAGRHAADTARPRLRVKVTGRRSLVQSGGCGSRS